MKRAFMSMRRLEPSYGGAVLLAMAALFVFGAIIGSAVASGILASGSGRLYEMLINYLLGFSDEYVRPSFLTALFVNFRYHVIIFLISFTGLGVFLVPAFVMLRGAFLSVAVTGFVRMLGINGAFLSLAAFGLQNALALPALLLLSQNAYLFAKNGYRRGVPAGGRRVMAGIKADQYFSLCGIVFAVLFFCALIERFLSPLLIAYIHNFL